MTSTKKKRPTWREHSDDLNNKAHGLYHALLRLADSVRATYEALPAGDKKEQLIFHLCTAEAALKEHNPAQAPNETAG